jgi:hypothetical protein
MYCMYIARSRHIISRVLGKHITLLDKHEIVWQPCGSLREAVSPRIRKVGAASKLSQNRKLGRVLGRSYSALDKSWSCSGAGRPCMVAETLPIAFSTLGQWRHWPEQKEQRSGLVPRKCDHASRPRPPRIRPRFVLAIHRPW